MVVAIIAGRGGTGKTSSLLFLASVIQPCAWAVMEQKDVRAVNDKVQNSEQMDAYNITHFRSDYLVDPGKTLTQFQDFRDYVLNEPKLKLIVVDGISDLRDYAIEEWVQLDNQQRKEDGRAERKTIGADNLTAWGEVNKRVRVLLEPIINYGISHAVHVFFTAQMKSVYKNHDRVGEEPDIKEWIEYPCEAILVLHKTGDRYYCDCEKAPAWSKGTFTEDLTKDSGLLTVLGKWGLL